jgi:hypothetical protein
VHQFVRHGAAALLLQLVLIDQDGVATDAAPAAGGASMNSTLR